MASAGKVVNDPIAAKGAKGTGGWGVGMKIALGLLVFALLAAAAGGLAIGLGRRRDKNDSTDTPTPNSSGTASTRDLGTAAGRTPGTDSTGANDEPAATPNADCDSFFDVVTATPELSHLVGVIEAAGVQEMWSDKESNSTLLAVSNTGIEKLSDELLMSVSSNTALLRNVLNMHMVPAPVSTASMANGGMLSTVTGGTLSISVSEGNITLTTADGATNSTITTRDIKTCKGYVHTIDTILLPSDQEVQKILGSSLSPGGAVVSGQLGGTLVSGQPGGAVVSGQLGGDGVAPEMAPVVVPAQTNRLLPGDDGKYSLCSGRWGPTKFTGPEPCGVRLRSSGRVNVGFQFGGVNGYFSIDAADGLDDSCFKASLAEMFEQELCAFKRVDGGVECLPMSGTKMHLQPSEPASEGKCICLAPFGEPAINKRWRGNTAFNMFLADLRDKSDLEKNGVAAENQVKVEQTLLGLLNITDCAGPTDTLGASEDLGGV